ncbi:hypothetical protein EP331_05620 [bacterium]|nr:MAG: hypothetical protein EP331_05620 [bacterium]
MKDELQKKNFIRICVINWLLSPVLMFFFAWPYFKFAQLLDVDASVDLIGSLLFGFGFTLTILHGHVSVAVGSLHRRIYYDWLEENPFSFGFLFHKALTTTRFRLSVISIALLMVIVGSLIEL